MKNLNRLMGSIMIEILRVSYETLRMTVKMQPQLKIIRTVEEFL